MPSHNRTHVYFQTAKSAQQCFICGGTTHGHITENGCSIFRCELCGSGITRRIKSESHLYEQHYLDYLGKPACLWINEIFTLRERVRRIQQHKSAGTILDFGCGPGNTLAQFDSQRWKRFGIDISNASCQMAREKGLCVECADLERANYLDNSFDVIMANHVLEHLDEPEAALKKMVRLLRSGGVLYIEVPNFNSVGSEAFKGKWPGIDIAHHNYHFTKSSMKQMLERNDLTILKDSTPRMKDLFFSLFLGRLMVRDYPETKACYFLNIPRIVLSLLRGRSEMLVYICRKQ